MCCGLHPERDQSERRAPLPGEGVGNWGCEGPGVRPGGEAGGEPATCIQGLARCRHPSPELRVSPTPWRGRPAEAADPRDLSGASRTPPARLRVNLLVQIL